MLDAVNDRAVFLTENDIAVLSHDLYDQLFFCTSRPFRPDAPAQIPGYAPAPAG